MEEIQSQVLVIDDDYEERKLISVMLQRIGIHSILVKDGLAALTLLEEGLKPALIILDLMMPEMDGFAVLDRIRQMKSINRVPVLILSATTDPQAIRRGLNAGADSYVSKPYIAHNLIDRVRVLITAGRLPESKTRSVSSTAPLHLPKNDSPATEKPQPKSQTLSD